MKSQQSVNGQPTQKVDNQSEKEQKPKIHHAKSKRNQIEEYLLARFRFRYNELNGRIEFTGKAKDDYRALEDYELNSIIRKLDNEKGVEAAPEKLKVILKSDFTPRYNPIRSYLHALSDVPPTGTKAINALAATVHVEKPELFELSLTKWLVASIANALAPEGCQNQTCLVLTGGQGAFKTTWLNLLCPPALTRYLFCGKINLESKDTLLLLGEKLIINLDDQLRSLNKRDGETVKTLITQGNVTVRRPYDALFTELPRIASFLGSVNGNDFLTDPTGSRRFLPFEVLNKGIDIDAAQRIDMTQVWAEAYALYRAGMTYWFTADEAAELFDNNEAFQVHTPEYELLLDYFEPVEKKERATDFLTNAKIKEFLERSTAQKLRDKQLSEALQKLRFLRIMKKMDGKPMYRWALRERSEEERQRRNQDLD